ncbi:acetyl-CoA hydrolase/transferase C-terminal domain-containing protein [Algiphilus aromaticivorans]|uniref:acetyl-CoA hydrolase/transferase C-terminal domain-containing protein n=1 Tax=Algiphilus aromaticivorans TaxID=382454 RepID=UPI0005C14E01|nr:acetyl-CoA hydrolase/transferase C-terminal domain-containing protein [Algiphilus aromaticivorans]
MQKHARPEDCVEAIIARLGKRIVLGTPLGIGKPNALLDALYARAVEDPGIELDIITALSLNPPAPGSDLEARVLAPIAQRVWGDYPAMRWLADFQSGRTPSNVRVIEFYVQSGARLGHARAQQDYISSNYTHVARDMLSRGVNLLAQAVAVRDTDDGLVYSLASNPDVTLELLPMMRAVERPWMAVGQVQRGLPWMGNDAVVDATEFDALLDDGSPGHAPFAVPHEPVDDAAWAIGLRAASLVRDGGTLQVGIGSLGDACCHALRLRDTDNAGFNAALDAIAGRDAAEAIGGTKSFEAGLYVASELISNPLFSLFEAGIVRREVFDDIDIQQWAADGLLDGHGPLFERLHRQTGLPRISRGLLAAMQRYGLVHEELARDGQSLRLPDGESLANDLADPQVRAALDAGAAGPGLRGGISMHGAFFIGPGDLYERLQALDEVRRARIGMTSVAEVNRIYTDYRLERLQRRHPRFINITMKATLLGAAVSDQLDNGRVVSGVGGQFDFVAMAHQLPEGRSVLCLRAARGGGEAPESNIVWEYAHNTVPRHMRDIVVTEYGVADLRGKTDRECIEAMLAIADSRCQPALIEAAQAAGKLPADYTLPESARNNTPAGVREALAPFRKDGRLPDLPFGSDLRPEEIALIGRLKGLQKARKSWSGRLRLVRALLRPAPSDDERVAFALRHMELDGPDAPRLQRRLVRAAHAL